MSDRHVAVPASSLHTPSSSDRSSSSSSSSSSAPPLTAIYSVYVINKSGGLIYQKDFTAVSKRASNDYLRLAGTFHALHAITAGGLQIASTVTGSASSPAHTERATPDGTILPRNQEGIQTLEAKDFRLHCYQTLTGMKFLLIASPNYTAATMEKILQAVYLAYTDYVLKNPWYELDMPIRLEHFDTQTAKIMHQAMGQHHSGGGKEDRRKEN